MLENTYLKMPAYGFVIPTYRIIIISFFLSLIVYSGQNILFSTHWGGEKCLEVLVGRPEGKRPQGRPRRTWEDNIKWTLGR
jgi:hypothetical protein